MGAHYTGLLLLPPLGVLLVEDFRSRQVSLVWLIVLSVLSLWVAIVCHGLAAVLVNILCNLIVLTYLGLCAVVYLRIRKGRWINPLKGSIGSGDLLFLASLTPLFDLRSYVLFFIGALVVSLLWLMWARMRSPRADKVPLVGTTGATLMVLILLKTLL